MTSTLPPAPANALPLDEASCVPLKSGIEGRYGLCPLVSLIANPHAVTVHPKRQIDKLARSINVTGPIAPVIIDNHYTILAGHARVEALRQSGVSHVPVVQVFGLTEAQKRAYLIADNRIGTDARIDRQKLALQLPELTVLFEEAGLEITDTGLEAAEIDELVLDFEDEPNEPADDVDPALIDEPIGLQAGDVLELGGHRLIVGDARDPVVLDGLMAGERADAAFLDVPYNVEIGSIVGRGRVQHPEFRFASGEMTRPEFVAFLNSALTEAGRVSRPGAVHFVCIDWKHVRDLIEAAEAVYGAYLQLVVWNKTNAGQGGLYRNQHELIGVFRVGEERHDDNVQQGRFGRNRSNVWTYAGANTFRAGRLADLAAHPTVKPTPLVADALRDVTRRGGVVLDTFVGSGTTILAGERTGRRVRAVEIEPRYAQIAARRWEALTGQVAVHRATGLTLDELRQAKAVTLPSPPTTSGDQASAAPALPRARTRTRAQP